MREYKLRQLLTRVALGAIPWSVATVGMGCGDSTATDNADAASSGASSPEGATADQSTGPDQSAPNDSASAGDATSADAPSDEGRPTDGTTADTTAGDASGGDAADGQATDVALTDSPTASDPCSPPSPQPGCGGAVNYCVVPDASTQALADGGSFGAACAPFCSRGGTGCSLVEVDAQQLVRCTALCTGRRPAGLGEGGRQPQRTEVAAYLEEMAYLEAASVPAFASLRDELRHHGAPRSLVRAAARAARDEVRHARVMRGLARRQDAVCREPRVAKRPIRSLADIAIDNATEGCVRETYGALVAIHQSRAAGDAGMRGAMTRIADDETKHAALAWKVAAWIEGRLSAKDRRRVADARRSAVEEIANAAGHEPPASVRRFAGLPNARHATQMVTRMREQLWRC
ncbi:MAG TPA: hypothetical protein VKU41_14185 [Polyangiaceae bacterium]|nr:hypothetical protein [Polyangiaceae bacterium]